MNMKPDPDPVDERPPVAAVTTELFGPASPVLTINEQPVAWLESPMLLQRAERAWWAERMEHYR